MAAAAPESLYNKKPEPAKVVQAGSLSQAGNVVSKTLS